jgi:heat shock protein HtpX
MLRIVLFLATNFAVLILLSAVMKIAESVFGVRLGGNTTGLLIMCGVFGMGGAFISLAISKWMAKMSTGAQVIAEPRNELERWLVDTVKRQAQAAGIGMPEVAVYDSPDINAFATGMSRNNALVAVSTGLLRNMERHEAEAVLGHEVSHVANGDMVTLTLIQGVLNTFVMFFARIVGGLIDSALRGNRDDGGGRGFVYYIAVMVLEIVFGLLASMVVAWFSRYREFRADAGGAQLESREAMIAALERLRRAHEPAQLPQSIAAFGISGGIGKLWSSHPPLDERIAALRG